MASIPIALYFKVAPKGWSDHLLFVDVPFLDQMGYTALLTMIIIAVVSWFDGKGEDSDKGIDLDAEMFKTSNQFNIGAFAVLIVLAALYAFLWN